MFISSYASTTSPRLHLAIFAFFCLSSLRVEHITAHAQSTTSTDPASSKSPATCPAVTTGYITHTSPALCLRSESTSEGSVKDAARTPLSLATTTSASIVSGAATVTPSNTAVNSTSTILTSLVSTATAQEDGTTKEEGVNATTSSSMPLAERSMNVSSPISTPSTPLTTSTTPPSPSSPTTNSTSTSTPTSSTPTPTQSTTIEPSVSIDTDLDSPLDAAKFLSFEDWKKQNLAQAGQSVENLAGRGNNNGKSQDNTRRTRPENLNGLESLGEEAEIDIDFSFGSGSGSSSGSHNPHQQSNPTASINTPSAPSSSSAPTIRRKDAGKTSKERFNYASFDCAANILKTHPRSKSANSVLVENKDTYMLNECASPNKFLIVELCDDILVDTVVLANFEFFSSMFRTFRVSVSDRYPVKAEKWRELGVYEARNSRDVQAFLVVEPLIWARYLRVEFLSHYGSEYYCPVSLLRVHGTTMMEEFRHAELVNRGELDDDEEDEEEVKIVDDKATVVATNTTVQVLKTIDVDESQNSTSPSTPSSFSSAVPTSELNNTASASISSTASTSDPASAQSHIVVTSTSTRYYRDTPSTEPTSERSKSTPAANGISSVNTTVSASSSNSTTATSFMSSSTTILSASQSSNATSSAAQSPKASAPPSSSSTASTSSSINASIISSNTSSASASSSSSIIPTTPTSSAVSSSTQQHTSSTPPATQESFFKSISKRLSLLESNSTLSLQYIESQSSLLRDAFASASKRQIAHTTSFLNALNTTLVTELDRVRKESEELFVLIRAVTGEVEKMGRDGGREREVLAESVRVLAEEVVSLKKGQVGLMVVLVIVCAGMLVGQVGGAGFAAGTAPSSLVGMGRAYRGRTPGKRGGSGYGDDAEGPGSPDSAMIREPLSSGNEEGLDTPRSPDVYTPSLSLTPSVSAPTSAPVSTSKVKSTTKSVSVSASKVQSKTRWRWDSPFRRSTNSVTSATLREGDSTLSSSSSSSTEALPLVANTNTDTTDPARRASNTAMPTQRRAVSDGVLVSRLTDGTVDSNDPEDSLSNKSGGVDTSPNHRDGVGGDKGEDDGKEDVIQVNEDKKLDAVEQDDGFRRSA